MKKLFKGALSVIFLLTSVLTFSKGVEAKTATPKVPSLQETKKTTPLFLQHARSLFEKSQGNKLAWHYSHYSHASHYSHSSHTSHYSHYSSRY